MARNRNRNVGIDQGINRIVEGTVIEGSIRSEGSIRIDGHFVGDIHTTARLVIGSGPCGGQCGLCGLRIARRGDAATSAWSVC